MGHGVWTTSVLSLVVMATMNARAAPPAEVVALVVGNNKSLKSSRPDLHYADDDAAKFAMLFGTMAQPDHVVLLTRLDQESTAQYGQDVIPRASPTLRAMQDAVDALSEFVQTARAAGKRTAFYFVFAGHGDVERGKGYMELEDGPLRRDALTYVVETVHADTSHVLLDSCNAFFVVHPRRPGGRAWATPQDVAGGLDVKSSDTGVFLSTSAEAQVFEWSSLQSSIFSHLVRSGLSGAADTDGDGFVTYDELQGFVDVASGSIANRLYRPNLYVRSPQNTAVVMDLRSAHGHWMRLKGFDSRVTVRRSDGMRWLDIHPEPGFDPWVVVPWADVVVAAELPDSNGRRVTRQVNARGRRVVQPAMLDENSTSARGPALEDQLFAHAYGPQALVQARAKRVDLPPPVYGLSQDGLERLRLQLDILAQVQNRQRIATWLAFPALGVAAVPLLMAVGAVLVGSAWQVRSSPSTLDPQREAEGRRLAQDRPMLAPLVGATLGIIGALAGAPASMGSMMMLALSLPATGLLFGLFGLLALWDAPHPGFISSRAAWAGLLGSRPSVADANTPDKVVQVIQGYRREQRLLELRNLVLSMAAGVSGGVAILFGLSLVSGLAGWALLSAHASWPVGMAVLLGSGSAAAAGMLALGVAGVLLVLQPLQDAPAELIHAAAAEEPQADGE